MCVCVCVREGKRERRGGGAVINKQLLTNQTNTYAYGYNYV